MQRVTGTILNQIIPKDADFDAWYYRLRNAGNVIGYKKIATANGNHQPQR